MMMMMMMTMMIINNEGSDSQLTSFAVLEQFRFSGLGSSGMDRAIWEADVIVHVIVVASEQTCNKETSKYCLLQQTIVARSLGLLYIIFFGTDMNIIV